MIETSIRELENSKPRLFQRCFIHKNGALKYEYMGSSEFGMGDQAKSLKIMFEKELGLSIQPIDVFDKNIQVFIIASGMFDFISYAEVIKGLINEEWATQEPTHLNLFVRRHLEIKDEWCFTIDTEIWFDFVNGVFFTFTTESTSHLMETLGNIKKKLAESV